MGDSIAPVRLCCLQRHYDAVCPDGTVMCCLCLERVQIADLHVEDGEKVDLCRPCGAAEEEALRQREALRNAQ